MKSQEESQHKQGPTFGTPVPAHFHIDLLTRSPRHRVGSHSAALASPSMHGLHLHNLEFPLVLVRKLSFTTYRIGHEKKWTVTTFEEIFASMFFKWPVARLLVGISGAGVTWVGCFVYNSFVSAPRQNLYEFRLQPQILI
jgi:hypothetical protein